MMLKAIKHNINKSKMEYYKSTSKIKANVSDKYVYVRNAEEKGGVIDALLTEKQSALVANALQEVTDENFSQVWDILKAIKGVRFDYASN